MFGSTRVPVALRIGAAMLGVLATMAPASAQQPNNVAELHTELVHGQLAATHSITAPCAAAGMACRAEFIAAAPGSQARLSTTTPVGYSPANLAAAYRLPPASVGATGTIGILDTGAYPTLDSDLATYRKQYGLPTCTTANGCLTVADYHGGRPLTPSSDPDLEGAEEVSATETSLDVDMASAACPRCHIVEIQLPDQDAFVAPDSSQQEADFATATQTAIKFGANAVSISYGYPATPIAETGATGQALFHPGVPVLAAMGDSGVEAGPTTDWPQSLPWVISVGATSLYPANAGLTRFTEQVWAGSGSGCETDMPPAIGQPSAVSANCDGHRTSSDIAADGDPNTGVATYDGYAPESHQPPGWLVSGGSSVSAPFIAGLYVRGGQTAGVIGPNTLYAAPTSAFNDITVGSNAPFQLCQHDSLPAVLCNAGAGWDGPTGLGSPNGLAPFYPNTARQ